MGLLDVFLGKRKLDRRAPDKLFAIATAYVTLETELDMSTAGAASIVFQPLDTADFREIFDDTEQLLHSAAGDSNTTVSRHDDEFRYRWLILKDPDFEDLVTNVNLVGEGLASGGYAERVLCAVFSFKDNDGKTAYWIYNYKRGRWYPFVPTGEKSRDAEKELRLSAALGTELPVEPEAARWFPLWGIPI